MKTIDFWFSIGSTYTYLSVMRLPKIEESAGINVEWRPFSVRAIMMQMDNIPFANKPIKAKYMWRDIERRAQAYGIKASLPVPYPLEQFDLANRVAILGRQDGWCRDYVTVSYRKWFQDGQSPGSEPNLTDSLTEIDQCPESVISAAKSSDIEACYQQATAEALSLGVFGAPTFVVGEELFWGDDRLEDAVSWCQYGRVKFQEDPCRPVVS